MLIQQKLIEQTVNAGNRKEAKPEKGGRNSRHHYDRFLAFGRHTRKACTSGSPGRTSPNCMRHIYHIPGGLSSEENKKSPHRTFNLCGPIRTMEVVHSRGGGSENNSSYESFIVQFSRACGAPATRNIASGGHTVNKKNPGASFSAPGFFPIHRMKT